MTSVLLMMDVQRNMLEGEEPVPAAAEVAEAIGEVLEMARDAGVPVVHVRNNGGADDPDAPGTAGWELVHKVLEGEHVVDKRQPDAFAGTALADLLPERADIVLVGMQSEYCVQETALTALERGHSVTLVQGAHATYDGDLSAAETVRDVERGLAEQGAVLVPADELVLHR